MNIEGGRRRPNQTRESRRIREKDYNIKKVLQEVPSFTEGMTTIVKVVRGF